jgi:iron complex outermembrane recepter protein
MKRLFTVFFTTALGLCLSFGSFPAAFAQETNADEFTLEEITVTAEKRVENVQKTSISVTAINGDNIAENAQITLESILKDVPALSIQKSPQGGQIYIRGVGTNGDTNWVDPTVAVTVDNVYNGRAEAVFGAMYDIERVEVLRGPQGTLYGRNATGGSVNVITKNPNFKKFEGNANIQVGNYSLWHIDGGVNVPVSDQLAFRVALLKEQRDGYFSNGGRESNPTAVRGKLLFEPTDKLSMLLTMDYYHTKNLDNTSVPTAHAEGPPFMDWQPDPNDPWWVDPAHPADQKKDTFETFSLKVDYNLDWATATFIPAYTHSSRFVYGNLISGLMNPPPAGSPPWVLAELPDSAKSTMVEDQYTVEARLASLEESPVKWVAGAFYLSTKNQPSTATPTGVTSAGFEVYGNSRPVSSYAVFGQATYPITDIFRATGGLRYTKDKKSISSGIRSTTVSGYDTGLQTAENSYAATTFKAGVEYDLSAASMMYAQISSGYKSGGFSTTAFPPKSYKPEKLMAYEIGSKNRFADNRVQVNAEAYLYDYNQYQVQYALQAPSPLTGPYIPAGGSTYFGQYVLNAKTGRDYGVDLEFKALITANDQLDLTFAYQHARYGDLVLTDMDIPPGSVLAPGTKTFDLTGTPVAMTPEKSGTFGYQHMFDLSNGGLITAHAQIKYSDGYWVSIEKYWVDAFQKSYHTTDANVSYTSPDAAWVINGWIKNIENDYQMTMKFPLWRTMISDPRTYGATVSIKW